jgi:hypothetical protein
MAPFQDPLQQLHEEYQYEPMRKSSESGICMKEVVGWAGLIGPFLGGVLASPYLRDWFERLITSAVGK